MTGACDIKSIAVIGAGVMGAGIAAQCANAGLSVLLLDQPNDGPDRSAIAKGAIAKLLKSKPAALMHKRFAKLITPGNTEDDLAKLSDCDWIIEAIIEKPDAKHALYQAIDKVRKVGSIISSNTSTLPLTLLTKGMSDPFKKDFLITHFFNPPRYMRLLEIVTGPDTDKTQVDRIRTVGDYKLGKTLVDCKDTPGFIANRIGIFWMQAAVKYAFDMGITVEQADAVLSRPFGIPKTGVFGLLDLVGLDLMPHTIAAMKMVLKPDDPLLALGDAPPLILKMIGDGYTGRKGKGGFYRLNKDGGRKIKEAIHLATGDYAPAEKASPPNAALIKSAGLAAFLSQDDKVIQYAVRVMTETLAYAASLAPEISDDIASVDTAMRLGYNWKIGPFELIDQVGTKTFDQLLKTLNIAPPAILTDKPFYQNGQQLMPSGDYAPIKRAEGILLLSDIKRTEKPVTRNGSASLWDIGDGVLCLEVHTKMNALDAGVMEMIAKAIAIIPSKGYKGLVIHNEGTNFSIGANLGLALFAVNIAAWDQIEGMVKGGQDTYRALKLAPFPVVGAPSGMALGGGCEMLLHCDAVQAHAESYIGLVEVGVGIVPAWGGCKEMLSRWQANPKLPKGPIPAAQKVFETVGTAKVATSAFEAKDMMFLKPADGVTMNRDRLLADAKARVLDLANHYRPASEDDVMLGGPAAKVAMQMAIGNMKKLGLVTPHDEVVGTALADVLSGGKADPTEPVTPEELLTLERQSIMKLIRTSATLDRMEHMLETGKPLRN